MEGGEGKGQTGLPDSSLLCTEGQTITMRGGPWETELSTQEHVDAPALLCIDRNIYIFFLVVNIKYRH